MKITVKKHTRDIEHNFYGNQYVDLKIKQLAQQPKQARKSILLKGYKEISIIILFLIPVCYFGHMAEGSIPCTSSNAPVKCVSPIARADFSVKPTPTPAIKLPELALATEREQNMEIIKRIWGKDAYLGLAIARAESGYRSNAIDKDSDGTEDQGVFQINSIHNIPNMFDATANIAYAYSLYLREGTTPWNSSKHNWINWISE